VQNLKKSSLDSDEDVKIWWKKKSYGFGAHP